jgi:hypothetical protein
VDFSVSPRSSFTRPAAVTVAATIGTGLALWFSRGTLDVAGSATATLRVAALPSWPELAGLVALMLLLVGAVALSLRPAPGRATGARALGWDPALTDAFRPLLALPLLAVPYLPWLPDRLPVLRVLAGPAKWLVWAVVLAQVAWVVASIVAARTGRRWMRPSRTVASVGIFAASLAVYATTSALLSKTGFFPGGDEPHYLVLTQSLLRDRDLKIENNHERGDYREYYFAPLAPHYRTRGTDGEIYSIHPVGLPILSVPAYAAGGYAGVKWLLILLAAGTATLLWRWSEGLTGSVAAATFAWAAVALSAPFVLNSFTVYPEIPAAFCVMLAVGAVRPASPGGAPSPGAWRLWLAALAVAALPWLSTKYTGMALILAAVLAWHARGGRRVVVPLAPLAISLVGWLSFFYLIWGSPLPSVAYGADVQTDAATLLSGGPGLLFDQEYGVCAYAPVLLVGLLGLIQMGRARATRPLALELALAGAALMALVGSFALWWGGSAMPGRPVVAMLPLFAAPIAWHYQRASEHPARRAALQLLLLIGLVVTVTMIVAVGGNLAAQRRIGVSSLLEWLSPTWHLWNSAPDYIVSGPATATMRVLLWLAGAGVVAWTCRRTFLATGLTPGSAALRVTLTTACVGLVVASVAATVPSPQEQRHFDPQARSALAMLETYDSAVRPVAVRYDPFSRVEPSALPPLFSLSAVPGQRRDRQPLDVILNARFRLPAGEYEVELTGAEASDDTAEHDVGLQVGREGRPVQTWRARLGRGDTWTQPFTIPLDAQFIGFRATPEVERLVARLQLRPLQIVDAGRRLRADVVISSAAFGATTVYFHDADVYAESAGFWVRGQSTLRASVAKAPTSEGPLTLRVHSGPRANSVLFSTPRWSERVDLVPGVTREVVVPTEREEAVVPLTIAARDGFVPAETEPDSTDRRLLGSWISFAP